MKKIFTLFVAMVAFAFCAKAQVTVILEAHDVWGDGSGYQLLLDADHTAFGSIIPATGSLTSDATTTVDYSATFEYTIPADAEGNVNTTHMIVDGQGTISIPAGTYDYCITNPTPDDRIWIAAGDNGRGDDFVFDAAYIYHFTVSRNGNYDQVTLEMIPAGDDPYISATPTSLEMIASVGSVDETTVTISAYNLTADITVTATAPFAVSSTGANYSTTATIPAGGGTLHVQYAPTAAGNDNGIITLAYTGATNVTITVVGTGIDCGGFTAPYYCAFETEEDGMCWTIIDANNDGNPETGQGMFNIIDGYAVYVYSSSEAANDWLISPAIRIGANGTASFDYFARSASFVEAFSAYVIPEGQTYQTATQVLATQDVTNDYTAPETASIDLSAYANQTIQFAIKCESIADRWQFYVTNFEFESDPVSIEEVESNNVNVYPNPANSYVNVNATSNISNVEVYTIAGQKVADFTANGTNTVISTSNLSNGMYMMRINTENGTINKKFSVAR